MKYITEEQIEDFFSSLNRKYFRDEFYNLFIDYLENNNIQIYNEEEEDDLEQEVFKIAETKGYIGYDIICEITDMNIFKNKISEQVRRYGYYIFHFAYELPEENSISTSAVWKKWNQLPPLGWFGSWCNCGHFYPQTLDLSEQEPENDDYIRRKDIPRPRKVDIDEIEKVVFCSDNFFRLYLEDKTVLIVKPYKFDAGLTFKFTNNVLE